MSRKMQQNKLVIRWINVATWSNHNVKSNFPQVAKKYLAIFLSIPIRWLQSNAFGSYVVCDAVMRNAVLSLWQAQFRPQVINIIGIYMSQGQTFWSFIHRYFFDILNNGLIRHFFLHIWLFSSWYSAAFLSLSFGTKNSEYFSFLTSNSSVSSRWKYQNDFITSAR